jgi:hypothetical protein
MSIGPKTWSVLPHEPIEEIAPNLWRVEQALDSRNRRVMALARLADGRVVVHSAIALDEAGMARVDAWGEVAAILVPNRFHRRDAFIWQQRYPKAKVYAPRGAVSAVSKATEVHGTYADVPSDATFSARELAGIGDREGVLFVRGDEGTTAVFCDTLLNLPKVSGLMGIMLHPTGTLSVPRPTAVVFAKDKKALRADLERIADEGVVRVVPGHGAVVAENATERLRAAAARL